MPVTSSTTPDERVKLLVEAVKPSAFEPILREAADNIYEKLLYTVQDYLRENAEFNLQADIDSLRAHNRHVEAHLQQLCDALGVGRFDVQGQLDCIKSLQARAAQVSA